jgi:hypothetical protein
MISGKHTELWLLDTTGWNASCLIKTDEKMAGLSRAGQVHPWSRSVQAAADNVVLMKQQKLMHFLEPD